MNTDDQPITEDQLTFGHTIKDAPATCFVMLALAGGQARENWLARVTGYAAKTIHAAVLTLDVLGLAARIGQHKAWVLTSKASQLAAPLGDVIQNRALLPVLNTTTTTLNDPFAHAPKVVVVERVENRTLLPVLTPETDPDFDAALEALHAHNIKGATAEELATREWVNPDYVKAIMEDTARRGLPQWQTRALAIKRMRDADVPDTPEPDEGIAGAWSKAMAKKKYLGMNPHIIQS